MRHNPTNAERALWGALRPAQHLGIKFRRQQIIDRFIVDFYCHEAAFVVEVDGDIHDTQQEYDEERDSILSAYGLSILRVTNDQVMCNRKETVESILREALRRIARARSPR
jgi:very-short-patch-repair endonuclease